MSSELQAVVAAQSPLFLCPSELQTVVAAQSPLFWMSSELQAVVAAQSPLFLCPSELQTTFAAHSQKRRYENNHISLKSTNRFVDSLKRRFQCRTSSNFSNTIEIKERFLCVASNLFGPKRIENSLSNGISKAVASKTGENPSEIKKQFLMGFLQFFCD
ncbi:hypothetical protein OCL94_08310 [Macrococcus sp. TMW 2.2395]|nr:hypothetical protein [Macrococcus sp. TMW 2.2395]